MARRCPHLRDPPDMRSWAPSASAPS